MTKFIKPFWLNKKISLDSCCGLKNTLRKFKLHTVCEESMCPNISECFSSGVATFMILGDICTRDCAFCAVKKGRPYEVRDDEPELVRKAVKVLGLTYIVVTSPTRDDLKDGGAEYFCRTVKEIKSIDSRRKVEILIPDFSGAIGSIKKVAYSGAEVISHNIETVPSLYIKVRSGASYRRSIKVLKTIKGFNKKVFTKSGLMLGLGEKETEIINVLTELRKVGCDFLTLGQYLPPSLKHHPLKEYIDLEKFSYLKKCALGLGFKDVKSSPYVRSSYMAQSTLNPHG